MKTIANIKQLIFLMSAFLVSSIVSAQEADNIKARVNGNDVIVEYDFYNTYGEDSDVETWLYCSFDYGQSFTQVAYSDFDYQHRQKAKISWTTTKDFPTGLPNNDVIFKINVHVSYEEEEDCSYCEDGVVQEKRDCNKCDSGIITNCINCTWCLGDGVVTCNACKGRGILPTQINSQTIADATCYACNGKGSYNCVINHNCETYIKFSSDQRNYQTKVTSYCTNRIDIYGQTIYCENGKFEYKKTCNKCVGNGKVSKTKKEKESSLSGVIELIFAEVYKKKLALVVGNAKYYKGVATLNNPTNDATLMKDKLRKLGYTVYYIEDANKDSLETYIYWFEYALNDYDLGLFYYAGHAFEKNGINYLVPTDAPSPNSSSFEAKCVPMSDVINILSKGTNKASVVILDACRDPMRKTEESGVLSRGLSVVSASSKESVIVYSTAPGTTATDGEGYNSPFTEALANELENSPNSGVKDLFEKVLVKVRAKTGGRQNPWLNISAKNFKL